MKIILQIVHRAHTYIMQIVQLKIRESWKPSYMIYATHKVSVEISSLKAGQEGSAHCITEWESGPNIQHLNVNVFNYWFILDWTAAGL